MAEKKSKKEETGAQRDAKKEPGAIKIQSKWLFPICAVAAVIIIAIAAYFIYNNGTGLSSVPFSTFKANFRSAQRVGVVAEYTNLTQYNVYVEPCVSRVLYAIGASGRNRTDIDFLIIDQANQSCLYQRSLGEIALNNANSSYCLGIANSEPSVFLSYGSSNSTSLTASAIHVYGNANYMASCPIVVDLS